MEPPRRSITLLAATGPRSLERADETLSIDVLKLFRSGAVLVPA